MSFSKHPRQWKLPFGRGIHFSFCGLRAPGARKPPSSPLKVSHPSPELKRGSCLESQQPVPQFGVSVLATQEHRSRVLPTAAFSSEWSRHRHLLSRLASSHTCTPVCPELGLPLSRDSRARSRVCPLGAAPSGVSHADAVGRGPEEGRGAAPGRLRNCYGRSD